MADGDPIGTGVMFGASAAGTGLVSLAFSYPASCTTTGFFPTVTKCTNVLGSDLMTLNQGQSFALAVGAGGLVGCAVALFRHLRGQERPST